MEGKHNASARNRRESKRPAEEVNQSGRQTGSHQPGAKTPRHPGEPRNKSTTVKPSISPRDSLLASTNQLVKEFLTANTEEKQSVSLHQFVRNVASGKIPISTAVDAVREKFKGKTPNSSMIFRLLDVVGFMLESPNSRPHLEAFLTYMEDAGIVSIGEIVAVIDPNKLDECGFSTGLVTIAVRERTRNQYVLKAFSLWRECGMGYDLLQQIMYGQAWDPNSFEEMSRFRESVNAVAGKYSICPMRVLYELIAWCSWNDGEAITLLLDQYPVVKIEDVMRLMLSQYHALIKDYQMSKKQYWRVPKTIGVDFFRLFARLMLAGYFSLDGMYKYLDPPDAKLTGLVAHFMRVAKKAPIGLERKTPPVTHFISVTQCSSGETSLRTALRGLRRNRGRSFIILDSTSIHNARDAVNTRHGKLVEQANSKGSSLLPSHTSVDDGASNASPRDGKEGKTPSSTNDESAASKLLQASMYSEVVDVIKYDLLLSDNYAYVRDHIFALECDKFSLLRHLIDICEDLESPAWNITQQLLRHLQFTANFPIILHGNISLAMCRLMSRVVNKLMDKDLGHGINAITHLLELCGPILYLDLICFSKVLKFLEQALDEHIDVVCKIIWKYIFPSMALMLEGNCQLGARLWRILNKVPASKRYGVYHLYMTKVLGASSSQQVAWIYMVKAAHNGILVRTRSIFKRVTSAVSKAHRSAAVRSTFFTVSGMASVDPFAVSHTIISQCEMFDNLLAPLSETGKYFGHLTCDIFLFMLCLNQNQACFSSNSECDELGLSKRLSINAQLGAKFFRRHHSVDISPLLVGALTVLLRSMMINSLDIQMFHKDDSPEEYKGECYTYPLKAIKTRSSWSYPDDVSPAWLVLEYLSKLMEIAGGVPQLPEAHALTEDQLEAQAGGVLLRSEIMTQDPEDETCGTTSRESLAKSLLRPLFSHGFPLLAGKMRMEVLYDSDYRESVMLLCASVDRLQRFALQFSEFKENTDAIFHRFDTSQPPTHSFELPSFDEFRRFWEDGTAVYLATSVTNHPHPYDDGISESFFKKEFLEFIGSIHLTDIWVPMEQYDKTLQKINGWIKDGGSSHSSGFHRRMKKLRSRHAALEREMKQHMEHVEATKERFAEILKKGWLQPDAPIGPGITTAFIKQCIAPRILVNEAEALFCGRLVDLMLSNRVECFNFFDFCNSWSKMLMSMVRSCTEREAPLLAIFVNHMFSSIKKWCNNVKEFEEMVEGHPCYCTTFRFLPDKVLTHAQLVNGVRKWEGRILRSISYALELHMSDPDGGASKSNSKVPRPTWIDQKSAVVFLARCHEYFPLTTLSGRLVLSGLRAVTDNVQKNGWKDVYVAASTLIKTYEKYDREGRWLPDKK